MQPGSLVFVAIIATWAVYLLQHWVKRREYLVTARSVDRYSAAMRVLERRTPAVATPRSYPPVLNRPALTRVTMSADQQPAVRLSSGAARIAGAAHAAGAVGRAGASGVAGVARQVKAAGKAHSGRAHGSPVLTAIRALLLLGSAAGMPLLLVAHLLGRVGWSLVLADLFALVATVAWLRRDARSRRAHGSRSRRVATPQRAERPVSARRPAAAGRRRPARSGPARPAAARTRSARPAARPASARSDQHAVTEHRSATRPQPELLSESTQPISVEEMLADPQPVVLAAVGGTNTWQPVPVPPPTYTLKARVERREPVVYDDRYEDDDTELEVLELAEAVRRAANG